jgi:hypothetical protein
LGIFGLFLALAIPSPAQEMTIRQLYQNILVKSSEEGSLKPQVQEIDGKLDVVRTSPEAEIDAILPLAFQCTRSPNAWVREAGYNFFISVMIRFDSAKILEPYIDELIKLSDEDKVERPRILYILGSLNPKLPDKVIAYFDANLESTRNSSEEAQTIAVLLLEAAPADASILHRVLGFVSRRADSNLTDGVLHQLGLSRIQLPEAVDFISANLNQDDRRLRAGAVEAASRLDKDTRAQFNGQLSRIASDPEEPQDVRKQAAAALEP